MTENQQNLEKYRLISLVGNLYKTVAKILSEG